MKVILKQDVRGVGRKYDIKDVSDGYANNFLIPQKLAEYASKEAIKRAEILKSVTDAEILIRENLMQKQIEMLKGVKVTLKKKGNEKGSLFEKVHQTEIKMALKDEANIDIDSEFIIIEKPIKEAGEHKVSAQAGKFKGEFTVIVEVVN